MKGPVICFAVIATFLLSLEAGLAAWRAGAPLSTAPVFSLPVAPEKFKSPGRFQHVIDTYHASRGVEMRDLPEDNAKLTLFYLEWDQVEVKAMMEISGHAPEECNVAAGFALKSHEPNRILQGEGHEPLIFDVTTFADPAGNPVNVYKLAWVQGTGSWDIRTGDSRLGRMKKSFRRGKGAARVIECGVTGAGSEAEAWEIFRSSILSQLGWTAPA